MITSKYLGTHIVGSADAPVLNPQTCGYKETDGQRCSQPVMFQVFWCYPPNHPIHESYSYTCWEHAGPFAHSNVEMALIPLQPDYKYDLDAEQSVLEGEFQRLVKTWNDETAHLSSAVKSAMHPDYQRIIGMGPEVIPLVLKELRDNGGHWFWALRALTGIDQAKGIETVNGARAAWLQWGKEVGLLDTV